MPNNIRAILTVIVVLVGGAVVYFEQSAEDPSLKWIALALAIFMALAIWLFPESKSKADETE